jgi:transaldolase
LTSNPTIFDHAIKNSTDYDAAIRNKLKEGKSGEGLFFELALELAAPLTINTMPEGTLKGFANHGEVSRIVSADGDDCEAVLEEFAKAGIDISVLAAKLQDEGVTSFVKSWNDLMAVIASKSEDLQKAS